MTSVPEGISPEYDLGHKGALALGRVAIRSTEVSHLGRQLRGLFTGDPLPAELREAFDSYLEAVNDNSFAVADDVQGRLDEAHQFFLRQPGAGTTIPIHTVFIDRDGWFECHVLEEHLALLEARGLETT